MGAKSAIVAVENFYNTLDPTNFPNGTLPPIFLDDAPEETTPSTTEAGEVRTPYVILKDGGEDPEWFSGTAKGVFHSTMTMEIWYDRLSDADDAWYAILWNGQPPISKLGLAFAELVWDSPYVSGPVAIFPDMVFRRYGGMNKDNQRTHYISARLAVRHYQE